ncbi:MAG: type II toxin-antitoxin system Phd/YefM family antitoxin [Betaproteobacteria bacterium]|nr:type II toxin-antitoxin system Phd/YefM family antitoxin [Betaproteobacteria bacterium]
MRTVNIHEAKTHLSRLVEEVGKGKDIVIAKSGKPMAKLTRINPAKPLRKPGFLKGKIRIAADFDAPLPDDLLDAFEGKA